MTEALHTESTIKQYVTASPYAAYFSRNILSVGTTYDKNLFKFYYHLRLVGIDLDKLINSRFEYIEVDETKQNDSMTNQQHTSNPSAGQNSRSVTELKIKALKELWSYVTLYFQGQITTGDDDSLLNAKHAASIKQLKKYINRYARAHNLEFAIRHQFKNKVENTKHKVENTKHKEKSIDTFFNYAVYTGDNSKEDVLKNGIFYLLNFMCRARTKREWRSCLRSFLRILSYAVSAVVGIGEGLVAAVFAHIAGMALLPALLFIGIPAATVNFFLFRQDSFDTFKELLFGRLFLDKNGQSISKTKQKAVLFSFLFCVAAGASFYFVSLNSSLIGVGFVLSCFALPHVAILLIASVIAMVTGMALCNLFHVAISRFIKASDFSKSWQNFCESYKKAKGWELVQLIHDSFIKPLVIISLTVAVGLASAGVFAHKAYTTLGAAYKFAPNMAALLSKLVVFVAIPVNTFFYCLKIAGLCAWVELCMYKAYSCVKSCINNTATKDNEIKQPLLENNTEQKINQQQTSSNPIRTITNCFSGFKLFVLSAFSILNGYGQGAAALDPAASTYSLSGNFMTGLNTAAMNAASDSANLDACAKACAVHSVVRAEPTRNETSTKDGRDENSSPDNVAQFTTQNPN